MPVDRRCSYKDDFRGFERILLVELELERVAFTLVDSSLGHDETDSPNRCELVYYL